MDRFIRESKKNFLKASLKKNAVLYRKCRKLKKNTSFSFPIIFVSNSQNWDEITHRKKLDHAASSSDASNYLLTGGYCVHLSQV